MTERIPHDSDDEMSRRTQDQAACGGNPEADKTGGLYAFMAEFAEGKVPPARSMSQVYQQESYATEQRKWHRAGYMTEDGSWIAVTASRPRTGAHSDDSWVLVSTLSPDSSIENVTLNSRGIVSIGTNHPLRDGSQYVHFDPVDGHADPRHYEAIERVQQALTNLLIG